MGSAERDQGDQQADTYTRHIPTDHATLSVVISRNLCNAGDAGLIMTVTIYSLSTSSPVSTRMGDQESTLANSASYPWRIRKWAIKRQWHCSMAGKETVGLVTHWSLRHTHWMLNGPWQRLTPRLQFSVGYVALYELVLLNRHTQ